MDIARYLQSAIPALDVPKPAVVSIEYLAAELSPPPVRPVPTERTIQRVEDIQAIAVDELRKNREKWEWIKGITGSQIIELGKIIGQAIDRLNRKENLWRKKSKIPPRYHTERELRSFMPAQSRTYASLVMEPLRRNGGGGHIIVRSSDGFYSGYPVLEENPWSEKYKASIDCEHPRGFSQRAHCAGRLKKLKKNGGIWIRTRDGWYSGYPQPQLYANPLDL